MKKRIFTVIFLIILIVVTIPNAQASPLISPDQRALVYVKLDSPNDLSRFSTTRLPIYTMIDEGLLTGANLDDQQTLSETGLRYEVLDRDLSSGSYYLVESRSSRPIPNFALYGQVLLRITDGVLLKMDSLQADSLSRAGAELSLITLTPKPLPTAQSAPVFPDQIDHDPLIQGMIDQVTMQDVSDYDRQLAGELPVWVDGAWYTITSRYTYSGTPIQKATSYVGQHMAGLGLGVEYHSWGGSTYPNVIGEIPGLVNPDDIYIIGAHIDDVSGTPGADDNASGSVATLIAADILSQYHWGCTLRFAFWTGEEQGLRGSDAYAHRSSQNSENILGYLNLDMIAWNTPNSTPAIDLYYSTSIPESLAFAQLFADVVSAYNLDLVPGLGTGVTASDHYSFWQHGFNSILAIEDNADFNPYLHKSQDTPANTDLAYFTEFVKASIASYAHKSGCLIPSEGYLDGHVTAAEGGAPIIDATVTAVDSQGQLHSTTTDATGYYTQTLLAGTYTVTASALSYLPYMIGGVFVTTDTITTLDFALDIAPMDDPITGLEVTNDSPTELGSLTTLTATIDSGTHVTYALNFGDESTGSGQVTTHLYPVMGTYTSTVTATNNSSSATAIIKVTIVEPPCESVDLVGFTWLPLKPLSGTLITFTSTTNGTEPINFQWDFGDTYTDTGSTVIHAYTTAGTYTITVYATNACGEVQVNKDITILHQGQYFLPLVKNY